MIGIAPGRSAGNHPERNIGREDFRRKSRTALGGVHLHSGDELGENAQGGSSRLQSLHVQQLGILQLAIVAAGHRVQKRERRRLPTDDLRRLAAHEFEHIRVVLLRHDARTGAIFPRQFEIGELRHRKNYHVFRQAAQYAHKLRKRGQERSLAFAASHRGSKAVVERA